MLPVCPQCLPSLPPFFVNAGNAVITVGNQRPGKAYAFSALAIGYRFLAPTNHPFKDLKCLLLLSQHVQRSGVVPGRERTVPCYLKRLSHILQRFPILFLLVVHKRKSCEQPMVIAILAEFFPDQSASLRPVVCRYHTLDHCCCSFFL